MLEKKLSLNDSSDSSDSSSESGLNAPILAGILVITAAVSGGVGFLLGKLARRPPDLQNSVNMINIPEKYPLTPKEFFFCPERPSENEKLRGVLMYGGSQDLVYRPRPEEIAVDPDTDL